MRAIRKILILALLFPFLAATLAACSQKQKEESLSLGTPVRVQLPFIVDGTYQWNIVELFTLQNVKVLKGLAARFYVDPSVSRGQLRGRDPEIRYIRDQNGVIVAKDDLSLQLLTVYAHFEKLKKLDQAIGIKEGLLSYPRKVGVISNFKDPQNVVENNAQYAGEIDAFLMFPYNQKSLPLMANGGVIAHEHFHSIFQQLVILPSKDKYPQKKKDPTTHPVDEILSQVGLTSPETIASRESTPKEKALSPKDTYTLNFLRGVNEGLADVWGWIYSGDTHFVGRSLPQEKMNRELDVIPRQLYDKEELWQAVLQGAGENYLLAEDYRYGTQLAQTLKNFAVLYADRKKMSMPEVRIFMGQMILKMLPELQKKIVNLQQDEFLTLGQVVSLFSLQIQDLASSECDFMAKLMPRADRELTQMPNRCRQMEVQESESAP